MNQEIYNQEFVKNLFDEMSKTYGTTNMISSFGFCLRWRKQCIDLAVIKPGMVVYDLMTGMGECWNLINKQLNNQGKIVGLDISEAMCIKAIEQKKLMPKLHTEVLQEDFLDNSLKNESADCVTSAFGLKTFSNQQKKTAANQIARILKPGASFSLLEISVPENSLLLYPYMFYLKTCIPAIGKILLGNPDNYRMLGIYTENFKNCSLMKKYLEDAGLDVQFKNLFFGCATALYGKRPDQ